MGSWAIRVAMILYKTYSSDVSSGHFLPGEYIHVRQYFGWKRLPSSAWPWTNLSPCNNAPHFRRPLFHAYIGSLCQIMSIGLQLLCHFSVRLNVYVMSFLAMLIQSGKYFVFRIEMHDQLKLLGVVLAATCASQNMQNNSRYLPDQYIKFFFFYWPSARST